MIRTISLLTILSLLFTHTSNANFITATSANYTSYLSSLKPGDTLFLTAGNYNNQLNLTNRNGTASEPIVITGAGDGTVFNGNACCNTVNLTDCSYIVLKNFKLDGKNINYIDGVKAGGGGNHFAHHITLDNLVILNHGGNIDGDNQTVGISTKCAAWKWIIRHCIIIGAGTGIYLGNSDGTMPFVSGIIEYNLVINTRGYNMQVKAQNNGVRDLFPGTAVDSQKTIIRYNVWSKDSGSTQIGQGDGSRPCLLMDHFPSTGNGSNDMYEVYGNFFYNNPTEALMQVTANTTAYANIFVNHVAPASFGTVVMNNHDGFPPRTMNFFHNTIVSNSAVGGIGLYSPNTSYNQYCYANAVFSGGTPVLGFKPASTVDNITDTYANATNYVNAPFATLPGLDIFPKANKLKGTTTSSTLFEGYTDYDLDFNGLDYAWSFRGAYSGEGANPGWVLKLDTIPTLQDTVTSIDFPGDQKTLSGFLFPNPASEYVNWNLFSNKNISVSMDLLDVQGVHLKTVFRGEVKQGENTFRIDLRDVIPGFYFVHLQGRGVVESRKLLVIQ